ncbi:MAG: hypothetical protein AB7K71_09940 [Polyangiaceae bacterium]
MLRVEPTNHNDTGPCPCCGDLTRSVWGHVVRDDETRAVYYVRWTLNQAKHGAIWMLSIGDWVDAEHGHRDCVGLDCRAPEGSIAFMLVDAATTPWGNAPGLGTPLKREEVLGTPLAQEAFDLVDACLAQDDRLELMRRTLERPQPPRAWKPASRKRRR